MDELKPNFTFPLIIECVDTSNAGELLEVGERYRARQQTQYRTPGYKLDIPGGNCWFYAERFIIINEE
jgi:hypothetical protein